MERLFQAAAGIMAAVIMWIILSKQGKEYALLLSLGACCLVLFAAFGFLEPVCKIFAYCTEAVSDLILNIAKIVARHKIMIQDTLN